MKMIQSGNRSFVNELSPKIGSDTRDSQDPLNKSMGGKRDGDTGDFTA